MQLRRLLSRSTTRLLQARPLLLEPDFSDTLLGEEHVAWLAHPAWTNCVEALTLHGWKGQVCVGDGRILSPAYAAKAQRDETSPLLLGVLLSNQRGALQRLYGVPLHGPWPLHYCVSRPVADFSALALTVLGVTVAAERCEFDAALLPAPSGQPRVLPGVGE